jgi:hypothetical protein
MTKAQCREPAGQSAPLPARPRRHETRKRPQRGAHLRGQPVEQPHHQLESIAPGTAQAVRRPQPMRVHRSPAAGSCRRNSPDWRRSSTATRRSSRPAANAPSDAHTTGERSDARWTRTSTSPKTSTTPSQWHGRGRGGGLGGDETARSNPPMTHPGTQWLPTPIHRRRGGNPTGHGLPRRPARPPRWPRGRAPSPPGASVTGVSAAAHTRYRPLTRAAPAGDGAAAPPAHEHRAAAHAGDPALAAAR